MMPLFALLLLFFMPTIAVRSKHAKTTEDSFDLEETVNTAYETLSPYTRPPDDDPHVKHLKERGIEWEEPTKDNIRKKLIAEMAADRSRAEAEAARQHDSDDDEEDEVEKEAEDEQEEVDVSMPASVQHAKLVTLRRPSDDRPLAWDFKMRGIEWVDPTPENDRIAFADATARDSRRAQAHRQASVKRQIMEEIGFPLDLGTMPSHVPLRAVSHVTGNGTARTSVLAPQARDGGTDGRGRRHAAPQVLVHHVSTTTSESSLHAYAYYTIATALIVVAACWYCGIVVETLKEMSRRVYQSTDIFNRIRNAQLADALHGKVVECDQLRDANGVLSEALAAMQERLRSAEENIVELEESKQQASLREVALNSELQNRHSVVEGFAQNERLLQEHYAQSREISRRKEAALKERLDEQCLICESLNDAVEEMQRLITTIIEANDAIATERLQMVVPDTAPERNVATEARQLASLPDIPVDPITNTVQTEAVAPDRDAIQRFVNSVYSTLFSLPHGYDSLAMLLRDLSEDSGLNGEAVARELGYDSFEAFLQSPEMAPRILVGTLPNGRRLYKVYPTKVDLERYVTQQLGTDYGDTKRALARQREENSKLRRQLASTMERVERLKNEPRGRKPALDTSHFRKESTKNPLWNENSTGMFPGTDPASRFRPTSSTKNVDSPSTSRDASDRPGSASRSCQALSEDSTLSIQVRRRIDELERMVNCAICMDRHKDTAFACGHVYCHECAVELGKCTFGCKKQNGKPLSFKYRVFL